MKIALLTDGIPPYLIGGMQKHSFYLAKYFAQKKIFVDLYHPIIHGRTISAQDILNIFSENEKEFIKPFLIKFPKNNSLPGHYLRESYEYSSRIYDEFAKHPTVDFVYAKGFTGWKFAEEKKKGETLPKMGANFHGYEMFQQANTLKEKVQQYFFKGPVKYIISNADYVFSYGGKITDIIKNLSISEKKIIEIPAGISEDWLVKTVSEIHHPRKFVFVGRYEKRKGISELFKAITMIGKDYNFSFSFIGQIPDSKKIFSDKIIYHGQVVDIEKTKEIMSNADVLVCPSHSEGMPNVILEAMASGLAVIATNVGAINLMVSEKNGTLISKSDSVLIAKELINFINMPSELLKEKKSNSLYVVKNYLWDKVIETTISKIFF